MGVWQGLECLPAMLGVEGYSIQGHGISGGQL
jgi:hypothetical protein